MLGEILQAVLDEADQLLKGTGAQVMMKTQFLLKDTPDNTGNFVLLGLDGAPSSVQYPGGLTQVNWDWSFNSYNYEPDAYVDDKTGYSTALLNFIDTIRRHFSKGALGRKEITSKGYLYPGKRYVVAGADISYNGQTLTPGTPFIAVDGKTKFTTDNNGFVYAYGWLTTGMDAINETYGFQFTLSGVTPADAVDQDGLVMGYRIGFESTAFDSDTAFTEEDVILEKVTQINNPPFDGSEPIS